MAKEAKLSLFDQLNIMVNEIYSSNYLVKKTLEQSKKADRTENISEYTKEWMSRRHEAYATDREEYINATTSKLFFAEEGLLKNIEIAKVELWKQFVKAYPNSANKKFEECFIGNEIVDKSYSEDFKARYERMENGETGLETTLDGYLTFYITQMQTLNTFKEYVKIFNAVVGELSHDGYNLLYNRNVDEDIKEISVETLFALEGCVNYLYKGLEKQLVKQGLMVNSLAKKFTKNSTNENLKEKYAFESSIYSQLKDITEIASVLCEMTKVYGDRAEAMNVKPKYGLINNILEAGLNFRFSVPSEVLKVDPTNNKVFMSVNEVNELISGAMALPETASIVQHLAHEANLYPKYDLIDIESTKASLEILGKLHKDNIELKIGEKAAQENKSVEEYIKTLSLEDVKNLGTNQEASKHLLFSTPFGVVTFDGEQCIDVKTNKLIPIEDIKSIFISEKGEIMQAVHADTDSQTSVEQLAPKNAKPSAKIKTADEIILAIQAKNKNVIKPEQSNDGSGLNPSGGMRK